MSSYTRKVQELLLLFKCVTETGTDVLTSFAEKKLLRRYKGSFERFLDDKKHEIFHLWQCDKLSCCACPPTGCNFKRIGLMGDWIFKKIYNDHGLENSEHLVQNSGRIVEECLHKYITRKIAIQELDLSAISFLLRNCARLSPSEIDALVTITYYRSKICQAYMMNNFTYDFYIRAWTDLEKSLVYLTDTFYKGVIRKEIQYLRSINLEKEEITELLENIVEVNTVHVLQELNPSKDNVRATGGRLQNAAISYTKHVKPHIANEKCTFSVNQTQQAILKEAQLMREDTHGKRLRAIQNRKLSLKSERPMNLHIQKKTTDSFEIPVSWNLKPLEHFKLGAGKVTFRNPSNKGERFMQKAAREDRTYCDTFMCDGLFIDCIVDSRLEEKPKDRTHPGTFECDGLFIDCIVDSRLAEKPQDGKIVINDAFKRILNKHLYMKKICNSYESLHDWFLYSIKRIDITTGKINTGMECRYLLSHFDLNNGKYIESLHSDLKLAISQQSVNCAKAIAWKLTRFFVKTLPKKQVYDVWPGCVCNCKSKSKQDNLICALDIVIVVEVFNMKDASLRRKFFYNIPITYKEVNGYSKEANLISKRIDQFKGVEDELCTVNVSNNQAKELFTAHSKLCLITKSMIRSRGYCRQKQVYLKELCVQLFCRAKGIIPVGEAHFPTRLESITTDVLEGYPQLLAKDVKIGSEVGVSCRTGTGTLGGFVKFNGEDAFLTCAHVVLGRDMLGPNANRSEVHMNPVVVFCKNPSEREFQCGKLVYYVFPPELSEGTSVDAAIIRMDPSTQISQITVATDSEGHDLKSMYLNSNFVDYRSIGTNFELQVAAIGAVSPIQKLRHKICLVDKKQIEYETLAQSVNKRAVHFPQPLNIIDCNHFVGCVLNDVGKEELINPRTVTFHQQISMRNVSFRQGDSGMCIYVKWPGVEYQCLGMAIASHPDGGCIITPIKAILSAFKLI